MTSSGTTVMDTLQSVLTSVWSIVKIGNVEKSILIRLRFLSWSKRRLLNDMPVVSNVECYSKRDVPEVSAQCCTSQIMKSLGFISFPENLERSAHPQS